MTNPHQPADNAHVRVKALCAALEQDLHQMVQAINNRAALAGHWEEVADAQRAEIERLKAMRGLVYLACPYSHPDMAVRLARFQTVNDVAAQLMNEGEFIFSPISHTHPIALAGNLPTGWDFWSEYDRAVLLCCKKMVVLMLPGWDESMGVAAEIVIAQDLGIPIEYRDVESNDGRE